jgi:hypothetical protein
VPGGVPGNKFYWRHNSRGLHTYIATCCSANTEKTYSTYKNSCCSFLARKMETIRIVLNDFACSLYLLINLTATSDDVVVAIGGKTQYIHTHVGRYLKTRT